MSLSPHLASLPNPGGYARLWRKLLALPPEAHGTHPLDRMRGLVSVADLLAEFRVALQRGINVRGGKPEDNEPIDVGWVRDRNRLEDIQQRRVRVYQFERPEMRERFGHLLARHDD